MVTKVSPEVAQQIQEQGFAITGETGGQPKQTYWTPDGRKIRAAPSMREYIRRDSRGNMVEQGIRDANFDKGWLPQPPTEMKEFCPHCDKWHDTELEVTKCGDKKKTFDAKFIRKAKQELKSDNGELTELKSEIAELKELVNKLLEAR